MPPHTEQKLSIQQLTKKNEAERKRQRSDEEGGVERERDGEGGRGCWGLA